ncbi:MAG: hypothetical protein AUH25_02060 [Thaumarchaeota archaeon 13_1_40CM_38_12]|nr:MAG: hypothetical protein AUH25_02060 [Thaumarchaeota archaeon 13_1_40CM_38_12]OLD41005.1 MAG: hypothetical protein AUI60_03055 [Thaumarchaeota archaeon 13_1_40CM_2_39_4]
MSAEAKKKLLEQLDALKIFPKNNLVRQLQAQIKSKLEELAKKENIAIIPTVQEIVAKTNRSRSSKLRKYHHYIRLIQDNFPDLDYTTIRKQLSERKQGKEVSIPDAIWQNPSP